MPATATTTMCTLETFKAWLKTQGVDGTDDFRLVTAMDSASVEIESLVNIFFVKRQQTIQWDGDDVSTFRILDDAPIISIDSLTINGVVMAPATYKINVSTGVFYLLTGSFSQGIQNIVLTYTCGYDDQDGPLLPRDVYRATLDLAKQIYDELSAGVIAASSVTLGNNTMVVRASKYPMSVQRVIDNYEGQAARP